MKKEDLDKTINDIVNIKKTKAENDLKLNKFNIKKAPQSFKNLLSKDLDIVGDEFYTKFDNKQKKFNRFINSVVPEEDFNYMGDLLILPETKEGYKYLLVILDLATSEFDMEPMKTKEADETLKAYKKIIKRKIIKIPQISFRTDNGGEFKSSFNEYLVKNKVFHKWAVSGNHKQQAPIEGLNNTLSRLLNNYMNKKSLELKKTYKEWTDILDIVRKELNKYRKRDLDKLKKYQEKFYFSSTKAGEPDFKIGDIVHYRLFKPQDINGNEINDKGFRQGDRRLSIDAREIVKILYYPDEPYYRYVLKDLNNISFSKYDLKLSKKQSNTYTVKKIIDKKIQNKKTYYLVWWKKYLKKDSTWEPKEQLIEDGLEDYIKEYEENIKK